MSDVLDDALPDASSDRLIHSATALLISNGTGAVLGVVFWVVAARLYSPKDYGYGAAEVSAMLLLASLAQLNLPIVFPRFLYPAGARAGKLLRAGYAASIAAALAVAMLFLVFLHHNFIKPGTLPAVFFLVAVPLWVVFSIQDAALIGLRSTFWVPVENTSFSIMKILLLPVLVTVWARQGVFLSYAAPVVLCIAAISAYLFAKALPAHLRWAAGRVALPGRRAIARMMSGEWLAGIAYISLATMPTLLVAYELGATATAHFQVPWMAGTSIDFALYYVATAVISEASARAGDAAAIMRRAVRFTAWLLLPASVVLALCGRYLLEIEGAQYAARGTLLLQLLAAALPLLGVNVVYITFARLARRVRRIIAMPVAGSFLILAGSAVLLPHLGITAVGVAFLGGQGAVALVTLPSVVRQYRRADMNPGFGRHLPLVVKGIEERPLATDGHVARVGLAGRRNGDAEQGARAEPGSR